jgi:hypothetical protein
MSKKLAGIIAACVVVVIVVMVVVIPRLTPDPESAYDLTITSTGGGSVTTPGEGTSTYEAGTVVDLVAIPAGGHYFARWSGDVGTIPDVTAASTTITINGDYTITATFEAGETPPLKYNLTITSTGGGSVTTPGEGTFTHNAGTVADLVASPAGDHQFVNWSGDVGTIADARSTTTTITMNGDYTITANFEQVQLIQNWYDLYAIRDGLNGNYRLMNDLHNGTAGYEDLAGPKASGGQGWHPIGTYDHQFTGTFDGQGYEISGLFIDLPDEVYVGLFGYVGAGGVIKNVEVTHIDISGLEQVGALVGSSEGTVSNSHAAGSVTGSNFVGGLMGINEGTVINCYSSSSATGSDCVGGLTGVNAGTVSSCYASGSVTGDASVGGLVGWNFNGAVSNSFSTGRVTGRSKVGGLVGWNDKGTVSNSFWNKDTSGRKLSDGGTGKTTAQMRDIATFTDTATAGLDEPWDIIAVALGETDPACTWNIVDGETYPFHSWRLYPV